MPPAGEDTAQPQQKFGALLPLPEVPLFNSTLFRPADADGLVLVLYWWASW